MPLMPFRFWVSLQMCCGRLYRLLFSFAALVALRERLARCLILQKSCCRGPILYPVLQSCGCGIILAVRNHLLQLYQRHKKMPHITCGIFIIDFYLNRNATDRWYLLLVACLRLFLYRTHASKPPIRSFEIRPPNQLPVC